MTVNFIFFNLLATYYSAVDIIRGGSILCMRVDSSIYFFNTFTGKIEWQIDANYELENAIKEENKEENNDNENSDDDYSNNT